MSRRLSTFRVDSHLVGIDVEHVQEVMRHLRMTPVPLSPRTIRGLINLRGQIVTALDLRVRLSLPDRPSDALPMNVVLRSQDNPLSLLVDEIGDVLEVEESDFEPPPHTLTGAVRSLILGAYKLPGELLLLLDLARVAEVDA